MMRQLCYAFVLWTAVLCWAAGGRYQIVMLGDLHYDSEAYREPGKLNNLKEYQQKEMKRNLRSWKEGGASLKMLEKVGKAVNEHTPFVIQCGDFSQGDAGSEAMATNMILGCMATCKKYIKVPFIAVKGNHDPRGKGATDAVNKTLPSFWTAELKLDKPVTTTTFAYRHEADLFVFLDDVSLGKQEKVKEGDTEKTIFPNLDYLEKLLKDNPDARYTFIVCHFPILPTGASRWVPFGKAPFTAQRQHLLDLLCSRNAIILAGHIHKNTYIEFTSDKGTVSQVTSISLFNNEESRKRGKWTPGTAETFMAQPAVIKALEKDATVWKPFFDMYVPGLKHFDSLTGSGYSIVKISSDGVTVDFRSIDDDAYCETLKIR